MKFVMSLVAVFLVTACAEAPKREVAAEKQNFPKCEKAWAKLKAEKPPKEETAPNMIVESPRPEAPKAADGSNKPGCAVITYEITKAGLAENFKVIEKSDKASEEAALKALFGWTFRKFEAKNQAVMFVF